MLPVGAAVSRRAFGLESNSQARRVTSAVAGKRNRDTRTESWERVPRRKEIRGRFQNNNKIGRGGNVFLETRVPRTFPRQQVREMGTCSSRQEIRGRFHNNNKIGRCERVPRDKRSEDVSTTRSPGYGTCSSRQEIRGSFHKNRERRATESFHAGGADFRRS